jgi:translation initiation factor 3 subunit D
VGNNEVQEQTILSLHNMAPASLLDLVSALPDTQGWGPPVSTDTMLNGVPFAAYSKADKLGRMADWTEGKDRGERGGRQQYGNRNYRGMPFEICIRGV